MRRMHLKKKLKINNSKDFLKSVDDESGHLLFFR